MEKFELLIRADQDSYDAALLPVILKMCNLTHISFVSEKQVGTVSFMVGTTEFFIPVEGIIDIESVRIKLNEELEYNRGFLESVMKKLGNQRFVENAPPTVLDLERKKKSDAESKIKSIEERIRELEN